MQIVRSGRPPAAAAAAAGRKREGKAGSGEILVAECLGSAQRASSRRADDDAGKRRATSYEAEPRRLPVPAQEKQTRRGSRVVAAPHAVPCSAVTVTVTGWRWVGVWVKPAGNVSFAGHDAEGGVGSASSGALGASCPAARFCARSFSPRLRLGQRIITTTPKPRDVRDAAAGAAVKKCTQHVSVAARSHAA